MEISPDPILTGRALRLIIIAVACTIVALAVIHMRSGRRSRGGGVMAAIVLSMVGIAACIASLVSVRLVTRTEVETNRALRRTQEEVLAALRATTQPVERAMQEMAESDATAEVDRSRATSGSVAAQPVAPRPAGRAPVAAAPPDQRRRVRLSWPARLLLLVGGLVVAGYILKSATRRAQWESRSAAGSCSQR